MKPGKHEGMFCLTSWNGIRLRLHFSCFSTKTKLGFLSLMKGRVRFPTYEKRRKDTSEKLIYSMQMTLKYHPIITIKC